MSGELVSVGAGAFMPALSVTEAVQRRFAIVEFVREAMKPGVDFGCIPGTPKPTLLKPGAEKLCTLFGLTTRFQIIHCVEDWTGEKNGGEPFFYYLYRCQLWRDGRVIAEGDGSCNSFEQKYRWRDAQRICPHCGKNAIIKGKAEYGGGWLCFVKKGGCGAKFLDGDETIETQPVGRVPNPDVADQVNTVQKMAQKRALIAATLLAVNASEFFTQDEEERIVEPEPDAPILRDTLSPAAAPQTNTNAAPAPSASTETTPALEVPPLVVVEFEPLPETTPPDAFPSFPQPASVSDMPLETSSKMFLGTPPLTAAQARTAFEQKAHRQFGLTDRRDMAQLAVALLGGKPERWTAEVWQTATSKSTRQWQQAMQQEGTIGRIFANVHE